MNYKELLEQVLNEKLFPFEKVNNFLNSIGKENKVRGGWILNKKLTPEEFEKLVGENLKGSKVLKKDWGKEDEDLGKSYYMKYNDITLVYFPKSKIITKV